MIKDIKTVSPKTIQDKASLYWKLRYIVNHSKNDDNVFKEATRISQDILARK